MIDRYIRYAEPSAPSTWYYIAGHKGRSTTPSDTPANTVIPAGLPDLNFAVQLFSGVDPMLGSGAAPSGGFGVIRLPNETRQHDHLISKVMDGGTLELHEGRWESELVSTFTKVATMTTAGIAYSEDTLEIRLRDMAWLLSAPLHDNRYGGAGGADGVASLKGQIKPWLVGRCFNVTPRLVDPVKLIYQLNDGPIDELEELSDGNSGFTMADDGDVADYATLDAATITSGTYKTCKALGFFRVDDIPVYGFSATVRGDKTGGVYVDKRADIAERLLTRAGTVVSSIDSASISAMNIDHAGPCGFYFDQEISKAAALTEVLSGILGMWWIDDDGVLKLDYLKAPTGTAALTFAYGTECAGLATTDDYVIPRWKTLLGYQRNYTVRNDSQTSPSVASLNKIFYQTDAQWASAETASQRTYWPTSPEVKRFSGHFRSTEASPEATRQQGIFAGIPTNARNVARYRLEIFVPALDLVPYLGQVIAIAGTTRCGFTNPQKLLLVGVETTRQGMASIAHLWG